MNHTKVNFETSHVLLVVLISHIKYIMPTSFMYVFWPPPPQLSESPKEYNLFGIRNNVLDFFPLSCQEVN